ncbi:hypothetical protein KAW64_05925, partial [bacterium]|nr:hypothetical protein [bacterium]
HTLLYALDVNSGRLVGSDIVSGSRCEGAEIVGRYAYVAFPGTLRVYDLENGFQWLTSIDIEGRWIFLGTYLYIERPNEPDRLFDMTTAQEVTWSAPYNAIHRVMFPDHLIGEAFYLMGEDIRGSVLYDLRSGEIVGRIPQQMDTIAWDPENLLVFYTERSGLVADGTLKIYDPVQGTTVGTVVLDSSEAHQVAMELRWRLPSRLSLSGSRLRTTVPIAADLDGQYTLVGAQATYRITTDGRITCQIPLVKALTEPEAAADTDLFRNGQRLGRLAEGTCTVAWETDLPEYYHFGERFQCTPDKMAFVLGSGHAYEGGDILFWHDLDTGALTNYTQFPGYEIALLAADPLVLALRRNDVGHDEAAWMVAAYDPVSLPRTVPELAVVVGLTALDTRWGQGCGNDLSAYQGEHHYAGTDVPVSVKVPRLFSDLLIGTPITLTVSGGQLWTDRFTIDERNALRGFETVWRLPDEPGEYTLIAEIDGKATTIDIAVESFELLYVNPRHPCGGTDNPYRLYLGNFLD